MPKAILIIVLLFITSYSFSQKKKMDYTTFDIWKTIENPKISNNGQWVTYELKPGKGDPTLMIYNTFTSKTYSFERGTKPEIDYNSKFIAFRVKPPQDRVDRLKRKKTEHKDMPRDTLIIFHCETTKAERVPNLRKYRVPEKWGGYLMYTTERPTLFQDTLKTEEDSVEVKPKPTKKPRGQNDVNGFELSIRSIVSNSAITVPYVTQYDVSKRGPIVSWLTTGNDSTSVKLLQYLNIEEDSIYDIDNRKGDYKNLVLSEDGAQLAYVLNQDTVKSLIPPHELYIWNSDDRATKEVVSKITLSEVDELIFGHHLKAYFSEDGTRLYYGMAEIPMVQDTQLLDKEIVNVEVWNYQDQVLYTQQNVSAKKDAKRTYLNYYDLVSGKNIELANSEVSKIISDTKKYKGTYIGVNSRHYQKYTSWLGHDYKDVYRIDSETGKSKKILEKVNGSIYMSPNAKYAYWYSRPDSNWQVYHIGNSKRYNVTDKKEIVCNSELNDRPMDAYGYGMASWMDEDSGMLIYDRYDIWQVDPEKESKPVRLTSGRDEKIKYRYIRLDSDIKSLPYDTTIMVHFHRETDRSEGYALLNLKTSELKVVQEGPYKFTQRVIKAKNSNDLIYTKESFELFPDLIHTRTFDFTSMMKFSSANTQQRDYAWGEISTTEWINPYGDTLKGLIVLPDDFSLKKKYPLIVNFYERNSHTLHRHRAPYPHRSTINYAYYANKGYVIFNPDIEYRVGEPGESCYDAVISGVESLLEKGYVDKDRMALQGHSWGGYQIAHLITRTNMFKCAEAGAPVVNMVSAYGGIRWGTGRSRMFQYEKTQSRLGATLWEDKDVYLKNSPIFNMDKVETPVLIMHNDKDGAVPWYQGIEMFVALRRLGKKVWMLNYNDEPHWPTKRENRIDFNRRLEQFFDYYLMGAREPEWMSVGIPALEKGINSGY